MQEPVEYLSLFSEEVGLDIVFYPNFYKINKADEIFDQLKLIEYDSDIESQTCVYGKWINIPRKQVTFSPNLNNGSIPKKWPYFLEEIRYELEQYLINSNILPDISKINHVLINLYRDGKDYINPHVFGDKEMIVVLLSFGAIRNFKLYNKSNTSIIYDLKSSHGDLIVFKGVTTKKWKNSLPKRLKIKTSKIIISFSFNL